MDYTATKLVTGPTIEPLTIDELKTHVSIDQDAEDEWLKANLTAARLLVEDYTRRRLLTQTWDVWFDRFPSYPGGYPYPAIAGVITVPGPPLISVTHVKHFDAAGVEQTLTVDTDYTVDVNSEPGRIVPAYGQSWPTIRKIPNAVTIRCVCGYGATRVNVPAPLRLAIAQLVAYYHREREPVPLRALGSMLPLHCVDMMSRYALLEAVG